MKDLSATRLREGDAVLAAVRGSTKEPVAIFSNYGSAYVMRINDVPASTGYGEPVQKLFNFRDGERVVGGDGHGPRSARAKGTLAVAVTQERLRPALRRSTPHRELSTRAGRRFAKPAEGDEIVGVAVARREDVLCVVTSDARALLCTAEEVPELANPGRGVTVIKAGDDDTVVGFGLGTKREKDVIIAETEERQEAARRPRPLRGHRVAGGKGHTLEAQDIADRVHADPCAAQHRQLLN